MNAIHSTPVSLEEIARTGQTLTPDDQLDDVELSQDFEEPPSAANAAEDK